MTFGEKIQKLRKEAGLSQEELSDRLGVSRQAVSKWERDNGYPETEKIVRMSQIFHVTLDYLLKEEEAQTEGPALEPGIYVSRETAEGFLSHQKRRYLKIAIAAGAMVGSTALSFSEVSMLFFLMIWIAGMVLLFSVKLADHPYRKLWKEPLLFDKTAKAEYTAVYEKRKGFLQLSILLGIALIALGFLASPLLLATELPVADALILAAGMIAAGMGTFLCIFMSGLLRTLRLLVMNDTYWEKRKRG